MRTGSRARGAIRLALVGALAGAAGAPALAAVALRGATIHPVSGPPIPDGTLVIEGEAIAAVGAGVAVPPGAEVVDLAGKHVYPGLLHPTSALGLIEIGSVRGTVDTTEIGDINAHQRAEIGFNADSALLPVARSGGILTALVIPRGGHVWGTSALMRMDGWTWEEATVAAPVGMHLEYPPTQPPPEADAAAIEAAEKQRDETVDLLRETMARARAYGKAREAAGRGEAPEPDFNPRLEALRPVVEGTLPLFVHAGEKTQIEAALDWTEEEGISRVVLVASADAQYVAGRLAERKVPVILSGVLERPARAWEPYDAVYVAAGKLHAAGVEVAIGDAFAASSARDLPFHAAMAAAFGLPREVALRSVTLTPAEILGVADRLGSLEAGKEATLIVTDGDPLEIRTTIERAWIAGREVDLDDRQKQLWRRYRSRPAPAGR